MPQMFTFGIPNYFQFTFRHGPRTPSRADETVDVESDLKDNTGSDTSNQVKALVSSPSEGTYLPTKNVVKTLVSSPSFITRSIASSPCGTLGKLPLELRTMVYKRVLKFDKCIRHAPKFLDRHPPILAEEATHIEAIDAALLRTCRTVYQEAVHILYGMNRFNFRKPEDIEKFAHFGLGNTPFGYYRTASEPLSTVGNAPYGRLTMIRLLNLRFNGGRSASWSSWCEFFYPPEKQGQMVGFPALEWLSLDLRDWGLESEDASKIRVRSSLS